MSHLDRRTYQVSDTKLIQKYYANTLSSPHPIAQRHAPSLGRLVPFHLLERVHGFRFTASNSSPEADDSEQKWNVSASIAAGNPAGRAFTGCYAAEYPEHRGAEPWTAEFSISRSRSGGYWSLCSETFDLAFGAPNKPTRRCLDCPGHDLRSDRHQQGCQSEGRTKSCDLQAAPACAIPIITHRALP